MSFPEVISGSGSLPGFILANKVEIDAKLSREGTVLLRGFDVASAEDFDAAVESYGEDGFTYARSLSNAVRVNLTPRVFTANEAPPEVEIFLHHEMAQTPLYPSKLFFCCLEVPGGGGETPVCRSDRLLDRLTSDEPDMVARSREHGVRYTNTMPDADDASSGQGRSWRSTLSANTRDEAEARLAELGYTWAWQPDRSLRVTTPALPAIRDLGDGSESFFNQLIAAFRGWKDARNDPAKSVTYGDGAAIDPAQLQTAIDIADELSVDLAWQQGDVALLDNYRVMHGRRPYSGARRVVASLIG